jgi:hypothetical protein
VLARLDVRDAALAADPQRFEAVARLRPRTANSVAYPGAKAAELQQKMYPEIEPLQLTATPQEAYDAALDVITRRKWLAIDTRSPLGATAALRRSHVRRSWVSATTSSCASGRARAVRASTFAQLRVTAGTTSAPMRAACARSSTTSTMRPGLSQRGDRFQ